MRICYVNVIEQHAKWGAEWFVNQGFIRNGHETISLDFRANRPCLAEKFLLFEDFDVFLLQRGDWFPLELVESVNRPRFFWASELVARCRDQDRLFSSGLFDHVFVRGTACKRAVVKKGWLLPDRVSTLLSGFDETVHCRMPWVEKDIDVVFIGTILPRRRKILDRLQKKFKISEKKAFGKDMVELFNRAKIVLNVHAEEFPDTETRIFESLGCGTFVVSEVLADESPFRHREHLVEAESIEEIEELINYYLSHEEEREQIAMQGYNEALRNHTYTQRAKQIAHVMQRYLPYDDSFPAINPYKVKRYLRKEPFIRIIREAGQFFKKYGNRILGR
jgi:hypothetical protein